MLNLIDLVNAWQHAGNGTPVGRLNLFAQALLADGPVSFYHPLTDEQEDMTMLALYRVDHPRATLADLHQNPALALYTYHQLIHDLARVGLGPSKRGPTANPEGRTSPHTQAEFQMDSALASIGGAL